MTVTHVKTDREALTLTLTAEFDAAIGRVWELWADPRQLERWWGPPTYPATFVDHDMSPGGSITYFMTGPEGDRYHGWWRVLTVARPHSLEFEDGFADEAGKPNPSMPVTATRVTIGERDAGGTTMAIETIFPSVEAMEQLVKMGMEEGLTLAVGQIDAILAG